MGCGLELNKGIVVQYRHLLCDVKTKLKIALAIAFESTVFPVAGIGKEATTIFTAGSH